MAGTAWQDAEVARRFIDERRGGIPYGSDQTEIMLQVARYFLPDAGTIIDLGCGAGFLAQVLLTEYPQARALLLDHSEPMLERARQELARFGDRCDLRLADLAEQIHPHARAGEADLVVSGYAIHHLPHARKRTLYEEVHRLLRPGGLFINLEHVASPTPELEALFADRYIDCLAAFQKRPRPEVAAAYHSRPDKDDNILLSLEQQLDWLHEIGFEQVDCYFKWFELAVFGGVRSPSK
jgi:tRNA (cmo5U34)-methyltransferase